MLRFATPWALALLPVAVAAAWWMARGRARRSARLSLPGAADLSAIARSSWVRVDRALPWARGAVLVLVVVALARPQSGAREETVSTEGVDIVVALDNSGSMRCEDFRPLNRLAVAKRTVADFAEGRQADRIGLVVFSAIATTRCPLTLDHAMLRGFLDDVDFTPQEEDGTAIGLGLATAANRLRSSSARSKVVVVVTDGRNNRGQIGPEAAAEAAKALGVRVYTVGVGTEGEAPYPAYDGPLGKRYVMLREDLDEPLLKRIASATGGAYFRATDPEALRQVFAKIDALEKTRIESRVRVLYTELFPLALVPAGLLFLGEALLAATRLRRIP
jgi:Ca-activated chloride channel family protein